jgi:hypothetical protein
MDEAWRWIIHDARSVAARNSWKSSKHFKRQYKCTGCDELTCTKRYVVTWLLTDSSESPHAITASGTHGVRRAQVTQIGLRPALRERAAQLAREDRHRPAKSIAKQV